MDKRCWIKPLSHGIELYDVLPKITKDAPFLRFRGFVICVCGWLTGNTLWGMTSGREVSPASRPGWKKKFCCRTCWRLKSGTTALS